SDANLQPVTQWFEMGGEMKVPESAPASEHLAALRGIQGLMENIGRLGVQNKTDAPAAAAAGEFILEGLWAHKRISRSEERGFYAEKQKPSEPREPSGGRGPRRQYN